MADLKLNEELPLSGHEKIKIKNAKGSLRLVAFGKTDSFGVSAGAWQERLFFGGLTIYDSNYAQAVAGSGGNNLLKILKKGKYLFVWDCRANDSATSQHAGVYLSSIGLQDHILGVWGAGRYRHTMQGIYFWNLEAGETVRARVYSDQALTFKPVEIWVFAVTGL